MDKVWEFMYENADRVRFHQTECFSPYYEASEESIQRMGEWYRVDFNSFYRYEEIFANLFDTPFNKEMRDLLYDIMMHYFVKQEFILGQTETEYQIREYYTRILEGAYGEDVKEIFEGFSKEHRHKFARSLYHQEQQSESIYLFADVVSSLVKHCVVYRNRTQPDVILVYIQKYECSYEEKVLGILEKVFLPLSYTMRVFKGRHFGVVSAEQTLEIDEIEIM